MHRKKRTALLYHSLTWRGKRHSLVTNCANLWKKSPMNPPLSDSSSTDLPNADDWPVQRHATVIRPNRPGDIRRRRRRAIIIVITPAPSSSDTDTPNHSSRCVQTSPVFFSGGRSHSRTMSHSVFTVPRSPPFSKLHLARRTTGWAGKERLSPGQGRTGPQVPLLTHSLPSRLLFRRSVSVSGCSHPRLKRKLSDETEASPLSFLLLSLSLSPTPPSAAAPSMVSMA